MYSLVGAKKSSTSYHGFVDGAIHTWTFPVIPKEWQEVTLLTKSLFLAAGLRKPFKDYPLLLSNTTANTTQVCPSPATSAVSPQPPFSAPPSLQCTAADPTLFTLDLFTRIVSSQQKSISRPNYSQSTVLTGICLCVDASICVSHISVTYSGPEVFQSLRTPTGTPSCQRWTLHQGCYLASKWLLFNLSWNYCKLFKSTFCL